MAILQLLSKSPLALLSQAFRNKYIIWFFFYRIVFFPTNCSNKMVSLAILKHEG